MEVDITIDIAGCDMVLCVLEEDQRCGLLKHEINIYWELYEMC